MEEIHRDILRENLPYLLQNLKVRNFVDQIYSSRHKILSDEDFQKILAQGTESDQIRQIVVILRRSGPKAFDVFIHSLKTSGQEFIAEELQKEKRHELITDSHDAISQSPRKQSGGIDLTGYIQQVQKKCQSAKGYWYSSFLVQTDERVYQRCLTFFPDLHIDILERYAREKLPVCLKDSTYFVPSKRARYEMNTIKIDSDTEFEKANVKFDYIPNSFTCLADINKSWTSKFISIKVEIFEEDAPIKIVKDGKELEMQVKHVRDKDGTKMKLEAWEQFVSLLGVETWYELRNITVKVFKGICKLSTNVSTSANIVCFE